MARRQMATLKVFRFATFAAVAALTAGYLTTSSPSAAGTVTIAGHRYEVGSFHETGWRGEPLQIWTLR